jgi:two-component system response regulator AdeR
MTVNKLKVMVVDDSKVVLEHLGFVLDRAGYEVTVRGSALGTVQHVVKVRPDVLVLDVSMPALDGDRLVGMIREIDKKLVIILHSSLPLEQLDKLATQSGAHGAIKKTPDAIHFLLEFQRILLSAGRSTSSVRRYVTR